MKIRRTIKGYTHVMLSRATGAPEWKLSMIENGLDPGNELALKIAEVLECKTEDIFPVYPPSRFAEEYIKALTK
jgi:DNA-binding XRE family transcriptional regulator